MKNIEIPYNSEKGRRYRAFEILPGALSWTMLLTPVLLGILNVKIKIAGIEDPLPIAGVFIVGYLLIWFGKSVALNIRSLQG